MEWILQNEMEVHEREVAARARESAERRRVHNTSATPTSFGPTPMSSDAVHIERRENETFKQLARRVHNELRFQSKLVDVTLPGDRELVQPFHDALWTELERLGAVVTSASPGGMTTRLARDGELDRSLVTRVGDAVARVLS